MIQAQGQVGIGTTNPDSSSVLELKSSNSGFLMPRVTLLSLTDVVTIPSPAEGLMVYNLTTSCGIESGIHVFDGVKWNRLGYSGEMTQQRLIKNHIGFSNVVYSNINSTNSYAGFSSLFDGVDNTGGATFHANKSGSPSGDWGFGVSLPSKYNIQQVVLEGRNDCCTNRIENLVVRLYRCGVLVHSSSPITTAVHGSNIISIPNVYADEIRFVIPSGGKAGTGNVINFSELEIVGRS